MPDDLPHRPFHNRMMPGKRSKRNLDPSRAVALDAAGTGTPAGDPDDRAVLQGSVGGACWRTAAAGRRVPRWWSSSDTALARACGRDLSEGALCARLSNRASASIITDSLRLHQTFLRCRSTPMLSALGGNWGYPAGQGQGNSGKDG